MIDIHDIIKAEANVILETSTQFSGWSKWFTRIINFLIESNNFFALPSLKEESGNNFFLVFARENYVEFPYSLYVCNSLIDRGHYLNAMIEIRALYDSFVTCRYLYCNQEHSIPYTKGEKLIKTNKYLSSSDMYSYFSSDFAKKHYGLLSIFSHGKFGSKIFRFDYGAEATKIHLLPYFDKKYAGFIINHLYPLMYGIIRFRPIFFEHCLKPYSSALADEHREIIVFLEECVNSRDQLYPSEEWETIKNIFLQ